MHAGAGGQLDDVSVRVAEIYRPDKAMIDRAAHLFSFRLRFSQHRFEDVVVDGERDVQVERILPLEFERLAGGLKKRQARAVRHLEEGVQGALLVDLERADQRQAEKFLVEHPRLFGVAAAIRAVVQASYVGHVRLQRLFVQKKILTFLGDNTFWSNTSLRQAIFQAGRSSAPIEKVPTCRRSRTAARLAQTARRSSPPNPRWTSAGIFAAAFFLP